MEFSQEFIKECERKGVDLSLLVLSLSKTPTERIETNLRMLEFIQEIQTSTREEKR